MKTKYKVIMHTHWDRERYFTVDYSNVFLINHMIELIEFLEKNDDLVYMLDGQYILISDFLKETSEYKQRLYNLIKKGQIQIGPWYSQTDLILPNQESIVRNLYYGITKSLNITNKPLMVAYCPDTFGQNIQMPQIYKMFGIDYCLMWRGVSKKLTKNGAFNWISLDGSKIRAILLPAGYQGAKYLPNNLSQLDSRIKEIENKYKYYEFDNFLLMNGHDQMPIQKNIKEVCSKIKKLRPDSKIEITDLSSYSKDVDFSKSEDVFEDLNHCEFTRVHRTIDTTRMDIKSLIYEIERLIYNVLEPLSFIANKRGIYYPSKIIENILLSLFEVHAHDSMGLCNNDKTNQDIENRLKKIYRKVTNQIELTKRLMFENKHDEINLINTLPYKRKNEKVSIDILTKKPEFKLIDISGEEIRYRINNKSIEDMSRVDRQILAKRKNIKYYKTNVEFLINEIEGFGIKKIRILESKKPSLVFHKLSTKFLKIVDEIVNNKLVSFYSLGDDGDSYDSSPLKNDKMGKVYFKLENIKKKNNKVKLLYSANLPYDKIERQENIKSIRQDIELEIIDRKSHIGLYVDIINKTTNHQLFLEFTYLEGIKNILCGSQYGYVKRKNNYNLLKEWENKRWVEKPINSHKFQSYININDDITIVNNSCKSFYYENDKLSVPILRSYDYLGKSDLINRPGRASGMHIKSYDGMLIDKKIMHTFYIYKSSRNKNDSTESKKILTPIECYQAKKFNTFNVNEKELKDCNFVLNIDENLTVTCTKLSENKKYLFIRAYNSSDEMIVYKDEEGFYLSDVYENKNSNLIKDIKVKPNKIINILKEI